MIGDELRAGDAMAIVHCQSETEAERAIAELVGAFAFTDEMAEAPPLIHGIVN